MMTIVLLKQILELMKDVQMVVFYKTVLFQFSLLENGMLPTGGFFVGDAAFPSSSLRLQSFDWFAAVIHASLL
jgi:hypothetical protein